MNERNISLDMEIFLAMMQMDASDKIVWDKFSVMLKMIPLANALLKSGLPEDRIVRPIVMKKIEFIMKAVSKAQLSEIMAPPKIKWDYSGKVRPANEFVIPEEEIIVWMNTSLRAPLNDDGFNRYMELFAQIFPEYADELGIPGPF